jgi:AhpD family alkylhydroperoxidase
MNQRLELSRVAPEAIKPLYAIERYLRECGLDPTLLHLVKVRASQINGCAYCIDMHWKDARAAGETEERLYMLPAWEEATVYTPRERAALRLTEAMTLIVNGHVTDEVYEEARREFKEPELVNLALAISTINQWNRLCITFRVEPGKYQPPAKRS